jgi:hypothetical protein
LPVRSRYEALPRAIILDLMIIEPDAVRVTRCKLYYSVMIRSLASPASDIVAAAHPVHWTEKSLLLVTDAVCATGSKVSVVK